MSTSTSNTTKTSYRPSTLQISPSTKCQLISLCRTNYWWIQPSLLQKLCTMLDLGVWLNKYYPGWRHVPKRPNLISNEYHTFSSGNFKGEHQIMFQLEFMEEIGQKNYDMTKLKRKERQLRLVNTNSHCSPVCSAVNRQKTVSSSQ